MPTKLVGLDLPCESWTRARGGGGGPPRIRSREFIFGLPYVRPCDQTKLDLGNAQYEHAMCTIRKCHASGIAGYAENPDTSFLWDTPGFQELEDEGIGFFLRTDFCQFGTKYQKPTKLFVWGVNKAHIKLPKCARRRGCCSMTGNPHVSLRGKNCKHEFATHQLSALPLLGKWWRICDEIRSRQSHIICRI